MLNARTWHRFCVSAYLAFPAIIIAWELPEDSLIIWLPFAVIIWAFIVAFFGAIQGILLTFGRLYMGCPICNAKSNVVGGGRDGMYLDCPHCGSLRLKLGRLGRLQVIRSDSEEDDLADYCPDDSSPFMGPVRHFISSAIFFLPVIASIIVASVIYKFTFVYIILAFISCAFGGIVLNGVSSGCISDNHGTALRSKSPSRFWRKFAIWFLFYILTAGFPVLYALEERDKTAVSSEHAPVRDVQDAVSDE